MKKQLPESMMKCLRGRLDLEENDTSKDDIILKMDPVSIVRECSAWILGDPSWADQFAEWIELSGAKLKDFGM